MQSAVVQRWSSRRFCRLHGVDSGKKRITPHRLSRGWSRQIHSRPRAQPTISPWCGSSARARRWWRAISRCDQRASAKPSDWAEDRSGSWAQHVRPGARAGDSVHHEGASYGCVSMEWSSAPCTTAEGELIIHLGLLDLEEDLINWETDLEIELPPLLSPSSPLVPSSPPSSLVPLSNPEEAPNTPVPTPRKCPPVPAPRKCPPVPALQKWPPSHHSYLLHRCRLAASPLALSPLSVWCEPRGTAILQHRSPPPTASEARTPPRPVDPAAPPRLIAPLPPPSPVDPPAPPGSLVPPVLPWSGVDPLSPLDSSPLAVSHRCSVSFVCFWMSSLCVYRCPLPFGSLKTVIITWEDFISKES